MYESRNKAPALLSVAEDIVPVGELKTHLSEQIRNLREHRRPLVVTQNGRAAAVMLAPEEFDRLTYQARFVAAVSEGLEQAEAGRVMTHDDVGKLLQARFGIQLTSK